MKFHFIAFLTIDPSCEEKMKTRPEISWFILNMQPKIGVGCVFMKKPILSGRLREMFGEELYFFHRTTIPLSVWINNAHVEFHVQNFIDHKDFEKIKVDTTMNRCVRIDAIKFMHKFLTTPWYTFDNALKDFPRISEPFLRRLFTQ